MKHISLISILCFVLFSCKTENKGDLFIALNSEKTGIDFSNTIIETDTINVVNFQYIYNGGGVGIGDFNNDGLSDVVFTGNQVQSKVYLNKGDLKFNDITTVSRFNTTSSWVTGVSIIDINADGWDDIYLSVGGANCKSDCHNLLFINNKLNTDGIPTFTEQAKAYGLDDGLYSQQTVFFDYDMDDDLDAFIIHNGNVSFDKNSPIPKHYAPKFLADFLLRNDSVEGLSHPVFTNVSDSLGIINSGLSLGVTIEDFNNDNLPDIYVSNDFITDDLLYINKGFDSLSKSHQGFKESSKTYLKHQTYNAMGVDVSDINNDTHPDILIMDMLPQSYDRQKRMLGSMNYDKYLLAQKNNYASQYMHNTLQLGNGSIEDEIIKSSEVSFLTNISSTDWSWAPLMVDLDNDSHKDIYITNGYVKDITDLDFINYSNQNTIFGTKESRDKALKELVSKAKGVHIPNYIFKNNGNLKFNDVSTTWAPKLNSYSNGVAYADLDNDGDLELIINNINEEAIILKNTSSETHTNQSLRIKLKGTKTNKHAIGAKVSIWCDGEVQQQYQNVIKGYLSSMEPILHFGIKDSKVDSLKIIWPNNTVTTLNTIDSNSILEVDISSGKPINSTHKKVTTLVSNNSNLIQYKHQENAGHDYVKQHLLMRQYSKLGPVVTAADIDGKAGDELFIGGSKGHASTIWFQNKSGEYVIKQELESQFEDTDATFFDFDNDNDLDLFVASGGNEFMEDSEFLRDRLYLNDGKGVFKRSENSVPNATQSSAIVRPNDFDKDGDIDVFIGARIRPGKYPEIPQSQLLVNTNGFRSQTPEALQNIGMVTDATWQDIDKDGWDDLIIVGEWMAITIFKNNNGQLDKLDVNFVDSNGDSFKTHGWWNTIASGDFDNDGDIDFITGNQGLNNFYSPKKGNPLYVYNGDFDGNGSYDPIMAQSFNDHKSEGKLLTVHTRDDVMKQLVKLKTKYPTYEAFAQTDFKTLLNITNLEKETLKATTFLSSYIENLGNGTFKIITLPSICQSAPINDILIKDLNNDGYLDALLVGNDLSSESIYGKIDALNGVFLKGSENGFSAVTTEQSGFYVPGQSHHLIEFKTKEKKTVIMAMQNSDVAKLFTINDILVHD